MMAQAMEAVVRFLAEEAVSFSLHGLGSHSGMGEPPRL